MVQAYQWAVVILIRIDMDSYFIKNLYDSQLNVLVENVTVCNKGLTMGPTCPTLCSSGKGTDAKSGPPNPIGSEPSVL
jgi:hypothetical protein